MNEQEYSLVICGRKDDGKGICLYGTFHAARDGRTLCGQAAHEHETRTTYWYAARGHGEPTCKCCRKALGLQTSKFDRSLAML